MLVYYFFIKILFFFGIVRSLIKFDTLRDHFLFLGILYTSGVAFISYVFIFGWQNVNWQPWQVKLAQMIGVSPWISWIGQTFFLSTLYFWALGKFDEGVVFWTLLLIGIVLVFY